MDPITAAGAYATIAGLICTFKNERKGQQDQNAKQFVSWLEAQHREDLKEFILRTAELPTELDGLLKQDTEAILHRLNELRDLAVTMPGRIDGLAEMLQAQQPRSERLNILPHLIAEADRAVRQAEKSGVFLLRADTDKDWDVPLDVEILREVFERFRKMNVEGTLHHTFVVKESAAMRETVLIHVEGRIRKMDRLLKAMRRLIALREELDYLEQETRTRR